MVSSMFFTSNPTWYSGGSPSNFANAGQPEGALMQTIAVTTRQDTLAEAAETFTVTLVATTLPDGVTLGTATATGTINDDDTLTAAVTGAATVAEGAAASFPGDCIRTSTPMCQEGFKRPRRE